MLRPKKLQGSFLVSDETGKRGMTVKEAILSLISTIIGGGIVGLPYAFYHCGIIFGLILSVIIAVLTHRSCFLMLSTKDLVPANVE